jgi:hypothetical protein
MDAERRGFKRVAAKIIAHCSRRRSGTNLAERFLSFTKDLSLKGAHLVVNRDVRIGEHFTVGLEAPTSFIPILAYGEVVWLKGAGLDRGRRSDAVEAGIKFLKLDLSDAQKINEFLRFREEKRY